MYQGPIDEITEHLPYIHADYLPKEVQSLVYKMRTKLAPGQPTSFRGQAYDYLTAIYSIGIYSGICTLERNVKNRKEIQKARLYEPKTSEEEKPTILRPEEISFKYLHRGVLAGRSKSSSIWCGINKVKDRVVRFATDYGVSNELIASICLTIILAHLMSYKSIDIGLAQKEEQRFYKLFNAYTIIWP